MGIRVVLEFGIWYLEILGNFFGGVGFEQFGLEFWKFEIQTDRCMDLFRRDSMGKRSYTSY